MQVRNLNAIRQTFEEHGIEFLGLDGVRLLSGYVERLDESHRSGVLFGGLIPSAPASTMSAFDPQQTSDEPKLGAEFRLGMNGLFGQCCTL
jgi:hypothetical protein